VIYAEMTAPSSAQTTTVSTNTTSAQTAVNFTGDSVYILSTALVFVVRGSNPTATTGCMPIPANFPVQIKGIQPGDKLAFINATGTGSVYITQGV
jgi:hypothetical protein